MPLQAGFGQSVISANIRDMINAGRPHAQAVAAALNNAHPQGRAFGGMTPRMSGIGEHIGSHIGTGSHMGMSGIRQPELVSHLPAMLPHRDDGGSVQPTPGLQPSNTTQSPVGQSYIQRFAQMQPEQLQELVARLGNSPLASIAQRVLQAKRVTPAPTQYAQTATPTPLTDQGQQSAQAIPMPQYGVQQAARGGEAKHGEIKPGTVPILAAGGEFIIKPEHVARLGDGDVKEGHRRLDAWVVQERQRIIDTMEKLKPPVKS